MNHLSSSPAEKDNQPPLNLEDTLKWLSEQEFDGCLQVVANSVIYLIHLIQGKLFYATNSIAPWERLERHLRRLRKPNSKLTQEIIKQESLTLGNDWHHEAQMPADYHSILGLLEAQQLTQQEAVTLIRRITREVFESLLNLDEIANYQFIPREDYNLIILIKLDSVAFWQKCQKRIRAWQVYAPQVSSSYQRLYLGTQSNKKITNLPPEQNDLICKLLTGLNFRQISAIIHQDELIVAQILYPAIVNRTILLRSPQPPFDLLPQISSLSSLMERELANIDIANLDITNY